MKKAQNTIANCFIAARQSSFLSSIQTRIGVGSCESRFIFISSCLTKYIGNMMKKQMQKAQKGFTLIELMVVVAITGVLAAIAIPAYQDYTVRAKVTEGLTAAGMAKTGIAEFYADNNRFPSTNGLAGLDDATQYSTDIVDSLTITSDGKVEVEFSADLSTDITDSTDDTLTLSPIAMDNGGVEWACDNDTTGLADKFVPAGCRN